MAAAGKFSFLDIVNAQSKASSAECVDQYEEIYLSPYDVEESKTNFYSQEKIQELADSFLTVGQQQPTVLARIDGKYRIISGHRRNRANRLLVDQGHDEYKKVRYLYKDMTEATFELNLLVGNAFNRELTPYEKMEQTIRLKEALIRAKREDGLVIQGRLRDVIADVLGESKTNVARMEHIGTNLIDEAKEEFKAGNLGITAAYETSRLPKEHQRIVAEKTAAGENVRAQEIAGLVQERKNIECNKKKNIRERGEDNTPLPGQMFIEDFLDVLPVNEQQNMEQEVVNIKETDSYLQKTEVNSNKLQKQQGMHEKLSELTDLEITEMELEAAGERLEILKKYYSENDIRVRKQMILVAALCNFVYELKNVSVSDTDKE